MISHTPIRNRLLINNEQARMMMTGRPRFSVELEQLKWHSVIYNS